MARSMAIIVGLLVLLAGSVRAQESSAAVNGATSAPGSAVGSDSAVATKDSAASGKQGETWRYQQHNGLWWYWLPSNQWVYWTDGRWVPYEAKSYAQFNTSRRQRVTSSRGGESGNWGPVRYNQYGQRQYPYSQRSSGLQQLGPVPALGGVRSLPGWGGER